MPHSEPHRCGRRRYAVVPVTLYDARQRAHTGLLRDVSLGGMRITGLDQVPEANSQVMLNIGESGEHRFAAEVVRTGDHEAGLRFIDYDEDTLAALRELMIAH